MTSATVDSYPYCLVVEDCDHDYMALERVVQRRQIPMSLKRCLQGDEALAMFDTSTSQSMSTLPALIILDMGLPGKSDGRDVLQAIRKHPVLKRTPVVVFSAFADPAHIDWCHRNGANAYQVKQVDYRSFTCVADLLASYWSVDNTPTRTHSERAWPHEAETF